MSKLIRWETPFTDTQFPSVQLLISNAPETGEQLKALVAPDGSDRYPKYLVDFGSVVVFTCMEEAHSPRNDFEVGDEDKDLCTYLFPNSPWLTAYDPWRHFFPGAPHEQFFHYLIFGGDNNIEVITPNKATFSPIERTEVLQIPYKV